MHLLQQECSFILLVAPIRKAGILYSVQQLGYRLDNRDFLEHLDLDDKTILKWILEQHRLRGRGRN